MIKKTRYIFVILLLATTMAQADMGSFYNTYLNNHIDVIVNPLETYYSQSFQARYTFKNIGLRYSYETGYAKKTNLLYTKLEKTQSASNALMLDLGIFSWWNFTLSYTFANQVYEIPNENVLLKSNGTAGVGFNFRIPVFRGLFINTDFGANFSPIKGSADKNIDGTVPPDSMIPPNNFVRPGDVLGLKGTVNGNAAFVNIYYRLGLGYRF